MANQLLVELCENNVVANEGMNEIKRQIEQEAAEMVNFHMRPCLGDCGTCFGGTPIARINGKIVERDDTEAMALAIRDAIVHHQKNPRPAGKA